MYPLVFAAIVVVGVLVATALLQWLWNITIPEAFGNAKKIQYWVAFRLLLIGALLSSSPFIHFNKGL